MTVVRTWNPWKCHQTIIWLNEEKKWRSMYITHLNTWRHLRHALKYTLKKFVKRQRDIIAKIKASRTTRTHRIKSVFNIYQWEDIFLNSLNVKKMDFWDAKSFESERFVAAINIPTVDVVHLIIQVSQPAECRWYLYNTAIFSSISSQFPVYVNLTYFVYDELLKFIDW